MDMAPCMLMAFGACAGFVLDFNSGGRDPTRDLALVRQSVEPLSYFPVPVFYGVLWREEFSQ